MSYKKSILWVLPNWPYPPQDGASIARVKLIECIAKKGYAIDLLVFTDIEEKLSGCHPEINQIYPIKTKPTIKNAILRNIRYIYRSLINGSIPVTMQKFAEKKVREQVAEILNRQSWDILIYDGLHIAAHQIKSGHYQRTNNIKKIIYRAHNVESDIWYRMVSQEKNYFARKFLNTQAKRVTKFEKSLLKSVDAVASVSTDDHKKLSEIEASLYGHVVPISFNFVKPLPHLVIDNKLQIMFLGRLDWLPNKDGLRWFFSKVWPEVIRQRKDIHLVIAGSGDSRWLKPYLSLSNITFLGKVTNVEQIYQQSTLSIIPIFYGSGTRVKAIEACRYGRACLSTTIGVEGVGLQGGVSFYKVETASDWIDQLVELNTSEAEKIGFQAFQMAKEQFSDDHATVKFEQLLGMQ